MTTVVSAEPIMLNVAAPVVKKPRKPRAPSTKPKIKGIPVKPRNASKPGAVKLLKKRLPAKRNIIRRPISPWIAFLTAQDPRFEEQEKATGVKLEFMQRSNMMSSVWQDMTPEQKQPYKDIAAADRLRYEERLEKLTPEEKLILKEHRQRDRLRKKGEPAKAKSAFMYFNAAMRQKVVIENQGISFEDIGRKLGALWKDLSAEDKAPYQALSVRDKQRYDAEMVAHKAKQDEEKKNKKDGVVKDGTEKIILPDLVKPKKARAKTPAKATKASVPQPVATF